MKDSQYGRTLIETLSMVCLIGILTASGLQLYVKVMNIVRANYIMQQVFMKASELMENKIANEHNHKMVDVSLNDVKLSYGYSFCSPEETCKPRKEGNEYLIKVKGFFPVSLCNILKKKIKTQEYIGLKNVRADEVDLAPTYHNNCPTDDDISSMTFIIDKDFKKQTF